MKIAILGYDVEGKASYDYFAKQGGHEIKIHDQRIDVPVPEGVGSVLGENYLDGLEQYDLLVRTPGLQPELILEKNPNVADKITTQTNEFIKASPTKNIIGVTGTKGKGTTSTLIAKMLEADGLDVQLGGNIGTPPLTFINNLSSDSWVVLELSSFQLIDLKQPPHIAVCLMVVPEHLDWHTNNEEYFNAKKQLFAHQSSEDIAIYYAKNDISRDTVSASPGKKIPYMDSPGALIRDNNLIAGDSAICPVSEIRLIGQHNLQNICAALTAVWQITQNIKAIIAVLYTFEGLPHRLEMINELNGVRYYDDSYGTSPETAMVAIESFTEPIIAILGGRSKGIPFDDLAKFITGRSNVKNVITIGENGSEIAELLKKHDYQNIVDGATTIGEIVAQARQLAQPGDVILFSPASTSFDMFKNYKERGEKFTEAVQALV